MLSPEELERYARHNRAARDRRPGSGCAQGSARTGCRRRRAWRAGAALHGCSGAGVLGIVDDDAVALSNLQRQVIHATAEIGGAKGGECCRRDSPPQPACESRDACRAAGRGETRLALIGRYDIVADGSDNFWPPAIWCRMPVSLPGSRSSPPPSGVFDGTLTTIRAHERNAAGTPNPTYRCLFPEPPRRRAAFPLARKPAFSARSPECSAHSWRWK